MKTVIAVTDNEVIAFTPMSGNVYSNNITITKEAFIECYEKWIKPREQKDVEPVKHGHWISKFENGKVNTYCSACGSITYGLYRYCSDCGAKMDLDEVEK